MHYVILGTTHEHQPRHPGLKAKIFALAQSNEVKLVAEEGREGSVAENVARSLGLPRVLRIDMAESDKRAAGIFDALRQRPTTDVDENGKEILDEYGDPKPRHVYLRHADRVREEFWLDRVDEAQPTGAVLLICGFMHVDFVAEKIVKRGHCVSKDVFPPYLLGIKIEIIDDQSGARVLAECRPNKLSNSCSKAGVLRKNEPGN